MLYLLTFQVFQTAVAGKIHCRSKQVIDWSNSDVIKWLEDTGMENLVDLVSGLHWMAKNCSLSQKMIYVKG